MLTSCSPPHSLKLGVHGKPLLQFVVLLSCHAPTLGSLPGSRRLQIASLSERQFVNRVEHAYGISIEIYRALGEIGLIA